MEIKHNFSVVIYGNFEKYNEVISKARCRIFYKGLNRNGTYITDSFAEKLLKSIPYTPVKGIYDNMNGDYTDHGAKRNLGRIYGIVPENPNLQWENHVDSDGVERTYACVDVLIFTALYEEAYDIVGKSQSMELYSPSIKGVWKTYNGLRVYEYTEACFLGLQVLGDEVEPCFEGAAFFSFCDSLKDLVKKMEQYNLNFTQNQGGQQTMTALFKISDSEKENALWNLLNPNYNEEGNWEANYYICDVYDSYAVCRDKKQNKYVRVYYTKNNEDNSVVLGNIEDCYIIDVTADEEKALKTIQALNNNTYEKIDEKFNEGAEAINQVGELNTQIVELNSTVENLTQEKSQNEQKIGELNSQISTLNTEKETYSIQVNTLTEEKGALEQEVKDLSDYKLGIERNNKEQLIDSYATKLDEDQVKEFKDNIDTYSYEILDKELAYALVKKNPKLFSLDQKQGQTYVPKDNDTLTGIEAILAKHKK